ncbi:hypothetical protein BN946_scf184298.g16 [Trametes cinnabarina]|uniref:Uncharacterized protein n=1 Tax=Pycnoporus cinnabarinus TaxID=5643 RepID=A0A060SXL7_PYCCI|nr:hypothetical protein BN946_scf184298.g16 [Trametes cinnabarina]
MLGQRIIESYGDLEGHDSPLFAEPSTGLTVRRIKSAGLRIVTERDTMTADASRSRSITLNLPDNRKPHHSVRTPDTSHTFGLPNPSMLPSEHSQSHSSSVSTPSSSASSELLTARRLSCYARAESALQSAVQVSSAEVSPQELQIRILEQATAILGEQARDAQACAQKLRACLAEQDLSPEEFRSVQRERWLLEHKSRARTDQTLQTRALMTQLSSLTGAHAESTNMDSSLALVASPSAMTRYEANLARFLQYSPTRLTFSGSPPGGSSSPLSPAMAYRRETISRVRPLQLRSTALDLALQAPLNLREHRRSKSLDGSGHSRSSSNTTDSDATVVSRGSSDQTTIAQTLMPHSKPASVHVSSPSVSKRVSEGTATIEKLRTLRSRDELLAQIGEVALPDYAVNLLQELVSSNVDVSLNEVSAIDEEDSPVFRISAESDFEIFASLTEPRPSTAPQIVQRLCSPPAHATLSTSSAPFPSVSPQSSPRQSVIRPRSSFRRSLHIPVPKFSSLRLASAPSLVPVAESPNSLPHSSLGAKHTLDSSSTSTIHSPEIRRRHGSGESSGDGYGRFSVVSFRRLSEYEGGRGGSGDGGVLSRFRRRLSSLGQ